MRLASRLMLLGALALAGCAGEPIETGPIDARIERQVAAAHLGDNPCPCGWQPRSASDVEALQTSLALSAEQPRANFHAIQVAGNA